MNINVDVTDISLDSEVGTRKVYDGDGVYDGHEPQTLGQAVAEDIANRLVKDDRYKRLRDEVFELRKEETRRQLEPIVAAAIAAPIQRTNTYGQPYGEPVTMTELIIQETRDFLGKVDSYRREDGTVVQKAIREAVSKTIRAELAEVIAEEKAKVVAAVRAKAAELIADAVKEGIGR
jgi:hypothetical protein